MTYKEQGNQLMSYSHSLCPPSTIRQWTNVWSGTSQFSDPRELMNASDITGQARLIFAQAVPVGAREVYFGGSEAVRCGNYIYMTERTGSGPYTAVIREYNITTMETVSLELGSATSYITGHSGYLCVIGSRKLMHMDYRLDETSPRTHWHIRILDFAVETIVESLTIPFNTSGLYKYPESVAVIRDANDEIHLLVENYYWDDNIGQDEWGNWEYGHYGITICHKNYTQDTAWEEYTVPTIAQDSDFIEYSCLFTIVDNRYFICHLAPVGPYRDPENDDYFQPVYFEEVVYDVLSPTVAPIAYSLQGFGDGSWESPGIVYAGVDHTAKLAYYHLGWIHAEDTAYLTSFNPETGAFVESSVILNLTDPTTYITMYMTEQHAYAHNALDDNFYNVDPPETLLGTIDLPWEDHNEHIVSQYTNICNLLDAGDSDGPWLWYYDYNDDKLKAVCVTTGVLKKNIAVMDFTNLFNTSVIHLGDSLLLVTQADYPNTTGINFYLVT